MAIKLIELSKILEKPIKKLIDNGYNVEIYHFPHCVLSETLWKYSKGVTADEGEVIFIEKCEKCSKKNACSKIWKSYLDIFSMEEFNPIKEKESDVEKKLKRINSIHYEDKFYQDKLYFLLDLKHVLRIQKNKNETFAEAIKELEDFKYCLYENYIFISKNFKKAQLAKELTKKLNMKNINPEESAKFNFQLGELYGYPPCCAENFPNINARNPIKEKEMSHQTEFKYENRKFHLPYYPCSENCEKTKKFKSLFKSKLKNLGLFQDEN
ncbi:DUF483 domain-containing protein [Patescibacteria group bacterium]|nr:DUF483 domain-containing protein [Patescibacteria group bacterium]